MKRRGLKLILILVILFVIISAFLIFRLQLNKKEAVNSENNLINNSYDEKEKTDLENLVNNTDNINNSINNQTLNQTIKKGGGGGGGSSGGSSPPGSSDLCIGISCDNGYECSAGVCIPKESVCLNAENNNLCDGLNIAFEEGYKEACLSKYGIC